MPRTSQPSTSYSYSASSDSSSFLSAKNKALSPKNKALSPKPNFNPFSPLSPELELDDEDNGQGTLFAMEDVKDATGLSKPSERVYSRKQLLDIAQSCKSRGWTKPKEMGTLKSWFGNTITGTVYEDPAIASIGGPPNRRGGGFGEGFGYGGGIGGKGLSRGGRHTGMRRGEDHGKVNQHDSSSKEQVGGAMGKFAVRQTGEKMRLGGDEHGKPKDEWRRDKPPHQRQDRRTWNSRQEEDTAEPAWMDDQPEQDPAIVQIQDDALQQFVPGEDRIAAHKRAMKTAAQQGSDGGRPLVGFFGGEAPVKVKPVKEYNAANYLLRSKDKGEHKGEQEKTEPKKASGSSRFQTLFGYPNQGRFGAEESDVPRAPPAAQSDVGPQHPSAASNPISPPPMPNLYSNTQSQYPSAASNPISPPPIPKQYLNAQPPSMRSPIRSPEPAGNAEASHQGRLMNMLAQSVPPVPKDPTPYRQTPPPAQGYYQQRALSPPPMGPVPATYNQLPPATYRADYRQEPHHNSSGADHYSSSGPPPMAPNYPNHQAPLYPPYYDAPPPSQHYQQGYIPQPHYDMSRHYPPPPPPGLLPQHQQWPGAPGPQYQAPASFRPPAQPMSDAQSRNLYAMLNSNFQPPGSQR